MMLVYRVTVFMVPDSLYVLPLFTIYVWCVCVTHHTYVCVSHITYLLTTTILWTRQSRHWQHLEGSLSSHLTHNTQDTHSLTFTHILLNLIPFKSFYFPKIILANNTSYMYVLLWATGVSKLNVKIVNIYYTKIWSVDFSLWRVGFSFSNKVNSGLKKIMRVWLYSRDCEFVKGIKWHYQYT